MLETTPFDRPGTRSADLVVEGGTRPDRGEPYVVTVPGDKSVSHRAVLAALLPGAPTRLVIRNANLGGAVRALLPAMRALGLRVTVVGTTITVARDGTVVPQSQRPHPDGSDWPTGVPYLETEGSSAAARLLIGILAGTGRAAVVDGDDTLRHRPMSWLVDPLRELGADIVDLGAPGHLPVYVRGPVHRPGRVTLTVGSAQARAGVLLAAVAARLPVTVGYPVRSRDHTERMLTSFGARLTESPHELSYDGSPTTVPSVIDVPADPSLAAYPVAAHLLAGGGGELRVPDACLNPTRLGYFEMLRTAGADLSYLDTHQSSSGEPVGTIVATGTTEGLESVRVEDLATLHALIDEVPLLAVTAAGLPGRSRIGCAEELRFKETDRLSTTAGMAAAFGAWVTVVDDGLEVSGGASLSSGQVPSYEDHRIAMAAATLAAGLPGRTTVLGGACHRTSFPDFAEVLRALGVKITEVAS